MWLSTWPQDGRPQYAQHPTEQAAKNHADSKRAGGMQAVHFWAADDEEAG